MAVFQSPVLKVAVVYVYISVMSAIIIKRSYCTTGSGVKSGVFVFFVHYFVQVYNKFVFYVIRIKTNVSGLVLESDLEL